jgi:NADPH2:quinone reductase
MKAARVHEFGQGLVVDDVEEPTPGEDEVLFELRCAGVNPLDVWVTDGTVAGGSQSLPFVPGVEAAGEADGQRVMAHGFELGVRRDGFYRERAAIPRAALLPIPDEVSFEQAAGLFVPGATAWTLVHRVAEVRASDRVLVLGASGGVGTLVVQLVRALGATVWGQTSNAAKAAFVEVAGATRAVVADAAQLAERVAQLKPTVVIDPLADGFTVAAIAALEQFGRLVLYGASAGPVAESFDLRALYRKSIQLRTYSGTIEPEENIREAVSKCLEAVSRGELHVFVDEVLSLSNAPEAHRRIRAREVRGKLLLQP